MRIFSLLAFALAACATVPPPAPGDAVELTSRPVTLDASDPARTILGRLRYLGGVELSSPDKRFGGFSSLKWRGGRLWAVTDAGDWASFAPGEREGRLVGVEDFRIGDLLGPDGQPFTRGATWDSEALTPDGPGWLVGFEHEHRILHYPRLGAPGQASGLDPPAIFGPLEENKGVETLASRRGRLFVCAERLPTDAAPNCTLRGPRGTKPVRVAGPAGLDPKTAFPVDASWAADGILYILFRSWSGGSDNRAAIVARSPLGEMRTLATLLPPIVVDNWEGLALREEFGRTFLYLISDDNFGEHNVPARPAEWQRTMLLKFELVG